jgi:hypothetical protein
MRVANCVKTSSVFPIRPPSSSTPLDGQDHPDAYDDGGRLWSLRPSSAPSSRQRPSADDRDHLGATFHESCDDGADRFSPSSSGQ